MRLVDADALDMYECLRSYYGDAWRDAQKAIDDAPTVDAVKVVRCKNCVYFWDGVCTAHTDAICTDENEFCSWGERR